MRLRPGLLVLVALLAGCVSQPRATPTSELPPPRPYSILGLEAVMGANAAALVRQFGQPDLDAREGPARKLQFMSAICVLDAYLYPAQGGREPVVTHVDARLPDGREMDRSSCVAALTRREGAR